jgi:D-sedoheptulose 7-phosphate isomerase
MSYITESLKQAHETTGLILSNQEFLDSIAQATNLFINSFKNDGRVFSCGNGGSLCDSMHFAEELSGRYRKDRSPLPATSIMDPSHISCVANDYGYEHIFSRYLEAWLTSKDVVLAISTSGNSANVVQACEAAHKKGAKVVGLLGKDGGQLKDIVDVALVVPSPITDRIQEVHIKCIHIFIEGIERELFPENYL